MITPPISGIALVDYRDRIVITPYSWCRKFVALGKFTHDEIAPSSDNPMRWFFDNMMGKGKKWAVLSWCLYEDGTIEDLLTDTLDSRATKAEANKAFDLMVKFQNKTREELEELSGLFKATPDDLAYVERHFPSGQPAVPDPRSTEDHDLYQARLTVLAGLQPKTVKLLRDANATVDVDRKRQIEREAVQAYFAELAHHWTDEQVKEWQRSNPVGTEWLCEFAKVRAEPKRALDPINYELVLNWMRKKYNLLTAEEASREIKLATGESIEAGALKKRRERLGLTTKRSPGPRPNSEK